MNLTITDDMIIKYVTGGNEYKLDKMILNENGQDHVVYEPTTTDYSTMYFTLESLEDGNEITFTKGSGAPENTFYYSTNDGDTWTSANSTTTWSGLNTGSKLMLKATTDTWSSSYGWTFSSTKTFNVYGNIMSLLYGDNFIGQTTFSVNGYGFRGLFNGCDKLIDASNFILPATTLIATCYYQMFYNCTSLIAAPELPATTLANGCYQNMFYGCTSLTSAPELPATTISAHCYRAMFQGCTSLTAAPDLPATTLATYCYANMFQGCTSLTTAPSELPATTLADYCYNNMFYGCTALATAPDLPATTLAPDCYYSMFQNCTSLTTAPSELPATTLATECYRAMFQKCTSLTTAPKLPATTLVTGCYRFMFNSCNSLTTVTCLATSISATDCLKSWVSYVASSGTFYKAASMTSWSRGNNGVPNNWTIQDAA